MTKDGKPLILDYGQADEPNGWPEWKRLLLLFGCIGGLVVIIAGALLLWAVISAFLEPWS